MVLNGEAELPSSIARNGPVHCCGTLWMDLAQLGVVPHGMSHTHSYLNQLHNLALIFSLPRIILGYSFTLLFFLLLIPSNAFLE